MPWILIADDDDVVRSLWAETLDRAGYRTVEAGTGQAAIELMRTVIPDVLIRDRHRPAPAADPVLQHLKQSPILRRIPVLIISGFLAEEPASAVTMNVIARLPKPISLARLKEAVAVGLAGASQ